MNLNKENSRTLIIAILSLIIGLLALLLPILHKPSLSDHSVNSITQRVPTFLDRIERTGELHAGYGVYPPYTQENPNTRKVTGLSVDIINQIANELKCKVVWHRLNWNTMSADLKRGEFDVIADPIFQTIPRAREFAFTEPYAYFADGIAVVRKDEKRFIDFNSLDQKGITIAVGQGWASETLLKTRFSKANISTIQTGTDLLQLFNEVLASRADVAVADAADALRFVNEHSTEVKALFIDNPPAYMPAGFALRLSDKDGAEFLSVCLRNLKATGVLDALAYKYKVRSRASFDSMN
jgi:ABC-type amino acid transport substrate-binding protein